jgi:bifunctional ADP-heptose synthase (sugar kinase/adenylyltransferase)
LILICLVLSPVAAQAQKRRAQSKKSKTTVSKTETSLEVRGGAERVAEQIKVLSKFLYLLGGVARSIEAADAAAQRGEASQSVINQTQQSKTTVRNSIQSLREQLDQLELDFRLKPELQRYYTSLAGSAASAAQAEDEAANSQFDRAGRTLLTVVNRLADVLLEMR